jgi:DNA mismatch endonuclease (patch repair protein)
MADVFTSAKRSRVMSQIRSKNTKPERQLRSALHRLGFRFRLHDRRLPGKPDIVLPKYKTAIDVRGCYWHGHECAVGHLPATRLEYWGEKIKRNVQRDMESVRVLRKNGWSVFVVWECDCRSRARFDKKLAYIVSLLLRHADLKNEK